MLFLAMQVRVMAACMESQIDKQEYTASAQSRARDGTGGINQPSDVCDLTVKHEMAAPYAMCKEGGVVKGGGGT